MDITLRRKGQIYFNFTAWSTSVYRIYMQVYQLSTMLGVGYS